MVNNLMHVCDILLAVLGALYFMRGVYTVIGLFYTKKFSAAKKLHRYAVIVAARNESAVIGNLLESIQKQDYPSALITTFVVADNCTDNTAAVARTSGAVCYERFDAVHCTKGYALQFLFRKIKKDYGIESFDGYFIFDADNLLKRDYIRRMNDAFDSGEKVITSYRNTKNFDEGWLAAGYGLHWLRTVRFESRARSALGFSTWIQGCGFLVSSELLKDGWNYTTLAEDRSLSSDLVARGIRISYQHEAQFFDEQPTSLHIAWRQRIRWSKGHLQALFESGKSLLCGIFGRRSMREKFMCYDMLLINLPLPMLTVPIKLIKTVLAVCLFVAAANFHVLSWTAFILTIFEIVIFEHLATIPMAWLIFFTERKRIPKMKWSRKFSASLMFPVFSMIGDISAWIAAFTKVIWKPIPHRASVKIEELEKIGETCSEWKKSA